METITIEKIIKFDSEIDSIESINVNDELRYTLDDDMSYAKGYISITGSVNTLLGKRDFKEDVDVDIYAPFEKKIDKDKFKIKVQDYSYVVKNNNLTIYLVLHFDGIIKDFTNDNQSIIEEINTLNEINENKDMVREEKDEVIEDEKEIEEVKIIEEVKDIKQETVNIVENKSIEKINDNWSEDLFKLNDSYVIFHKFKLK